MQKNIYKIVDYHGRVYLPKAMRDATDIEHGDIVRLGLENGNIAVGKVCLVEVGDHSGEAAEEFMVANFRRMSPQRQSEILRRLCANIPDKEAQS